MQKKLIREVVVFTTLLIFLALMMHPDLLSHPQERFSLMQERENFLHPFIYTFIIYTVIGVFRWIVKKVINLFTKRKNT
jgi:ABC-type multidrug transport system fused ATPase/permease subunit